MISQIERKPRRLLGPERNLFSDTGILIQTVTSINDVFWKLVLSFSRGFMKMLHFKLFLKMKNYLPSIILFVSPDLHAHLSLSLSLLSLVAFHLFFLSLQCVNI